MTHRERTTPVHPRIATPGTTPVSAVVIHHDNPAKVGVTRANAIPEDSAWNLKNGITNEERTEYLAHFGGA